MTSLYDHNKAVKTATELYLARLEEAWEEYQSTLGRAMEELRAGGDCMDAMPMKTINTVDYRAGRE